MDLPAKVAHCKRDECKEGDCHLDVSGLMSRINLFEMNCVKVATKHRGQICDFAVVWKRQKIVAVVELKGGRNTPLKKSVKQVQGGLDALEKLLQGQPVAKIYPVLLFRRRPPAAALKAARVRFRNEKRRIIARQSGYSLEKMLSEFP